MKTFSICYVASELAPLAKTGGLADAAAGLCGFLGTRGHDVRPFLPLYRRIRDAGLDLCRSPELQGIDLEFGRTRYRADVLTAPLEDGNVRVYLVDCPELYDRLELYGSERDEHLRFALLSRVAIEACQRMQWRPDVFHLNDWHTALLPLYLKTAYAWDRLFAGTRTLLAIHNLAYQGVFPLDTLVDLDLVRERHYLAREDLHRGRVNFLDTGLRHADRLVTVSRTYAEEIQTPELGAGLDRLLRQRGDVLSGIVNGVDYAQWSPETDPLLPANYSAEDLAGKAEVKRLLLEEFDLAPADGAPLLGVVSRFTDQKGLELLVEILPELLANHDLRLVALGSGAPQLEQSFEAMRDRFPTRMGVVIGFDNALAHRIEAGADAFLMPSRYEPCGLNQMYSLRYGTVPIVRRTGGLADTVAPFDRSTGIGTGFLFDAFAPQALGEAIRDALEVWESPEAWARLRRNGMAEDFSWERQGLEYELLYADMIAAADQDGVGDHTATSTPTSLRTEP